MNLPPSVRVGYLDYTVTDWPWDESKNASAGPAFGDCNVNHATIRVCTDFGPQRSSNVLLHEILHACWSAAGLRERESEERVVQSLADQLSQVWRDNPEFISFMSASVGVRA